MDYQKIKEDFNKKIWRLLSSMKKMISIVDTMVIDNEEGEKFVLELDTLLIDGEQRYITTKEPEICLFEVLDQQHIVSIDGTKAVAKNLFFFRPNNCPFGENQKLKIMGVTYNTIETENRLSTRFMISNGDKPKDMISVIFTSPEADIKI